jgi:hypothetical protein
MARSLLIPKRVIFSVWPVASGDRSLHQGSLGRKSSLQCWIARCRNETLISLWLYHPVLGRLTNKTRRRFESPYGRLHGRGCRLLVFRDSANDLAKKFLKERVTLQ